MYCLNCAHDRSPPHSQCQHTVFACACAFASTPATRIAERFHCSDTGYLLGASQWIGHQGLRRNPLAKFHRSRHSENGHHSANLRYGRSFYTCDTGLEACDWPSQNEAVQLSTEKAAGTSVIENNREMGRNGVKMG